MMYVIWAALTFASIQVRRKSLENFNWNLLKFPSSWFMPAICVYVHISVLFRGKVKQQACRQLTFLIRQYLVTLNQEMPLSKQSHDDSLLLFSTKIHHLKCLALVFNSSRSS